jgi:phage terminase small subunit
MARVLTERQQKFLAVLMDEAGGDISTAKIMAGYSANTSNLEVTNSLKEEIIDVTHSYLARNVPKAAMAMVGALYDPTELGIRDKMAAAKELLDRTGLVKTEKVQIEAKGGVMLMPAKNPTEEDECTCGKSTSACTCDD